MCYLLINVKHYKPLFYKGETILNKNDLISHMQEVGQKIGANAVKDYLDSNDIEIDDISLRFFVTDTSKVKWKPNSKFVKLFISEMEKLMKNKTITVEMLGFLTLLTPYLNYEDSCLINKDETPMSQNDIIKLTGWGRNKVSQTIKALIELEVIYEQKQENDKRRSKYYLNPNLFFKGQKIDKEVKKYYDDKKKSKNESNK